MSNTPELGASLPIPDPGCGWSTNSQTGNRMRSSSKRTLWGTTVQVPVDGDLVLCRDVLRVRHWWPGTQAT